MKRLFILFSLLLLATITFDFARQRFTSPRPNPPLSARPNNTSTPTVTPTDDQLFDSLGADQNLDIDSQFSALETNSQ